MRIAYLFQPTLDVGSSVQSILLCKQWDSFIPVSCNPISGSGSLQPVPSSELGEIYYPITSVLNALEGLDPDAVLIHTLSDNILGNIQQITAKWPTALRLGMNLIEFLMLEKWRRQIHKILFTLDNVDCVICPSKSVEHNLYTIGCRSLVTIPTAVDLSEWSLSNPASNLLVSIGRLSPVKNHVYSIFAVRAVGKNLPKLKYKIYGTGGMSSILKNLIGLTGATQWISLEGFKPAREVLPKAKLFIQNSINENCSLALLEAMASGVPVVASHIGGHVMGNVSYESIPETAEEIKKLLTDERYWQERRSEGLEKVQEYDVKKILPMYKTLFSTLTRLKDFKEESERLAKAEGEEEVASCESQ